MYHPPSKRVRFWRRFTVVGIMTVAVVAGVAVLTALTLGYSFSQEDGRIEQGGILQMNTAPSGATVTINGTRFGSQTPTKLVSQVGDYDITMERQGYRAWHNTVPIQAGNITWVTYPRLLPAELKPEQTLTYPATVASALSSGSSKRYAVLPNAGEAKLSVAMLDSDTVTSKDYELPATTYTTPAEGQALSHFEIESWTGDEKKVLLRHTYGTDNAVEWIVFNLEQPEESVNINRVLGITEPLSELTFTRGDGREIYALVGDAVRILDLGDETLSRPLVDGVEDFRIYGDKFVLYTTKLVDGHQEVGYVKRDYKAPRTVKKVASDGTGATQLDIGKYYDKYYFLVSHGREATLYSSPGMPDNTTSELALTHVKTLGLKQPILDANITDNGQFATVQDGTSFATFNLEVMRLSTTQLTTGAAATPQKLEYLDRYLFWGVNDGQLRTYEFDGANQHDVMPLLPKLGATLSPSGKYLYGFSQVDDNTVALSRVQLLDIKTQ